MKAKKPMFMSIINAAKFTGLSLRHFRRVYYENGDGELFQIKRAFFVKTVDLERWQRRRLKSA